MLNRLFSRRIRAQLAWAMVLILAVLLLTATPLLIGSYRNYKQAQLSLEHLHYLQLLANICNKVSKERGPSNVAMTDFSVDNTASIQQLYLFRQGVDADLQSAITQFRQHGYSRYADKLQQDVIPALNTGRVRVDNFIALPQSQKNSLEMARAVNTMFETWDSSHVVLKEFLYRYHGQNQEVADVYTLTLLLTEFRDQAGRLGSYIIPSLAFGEQLSATALDRVHRTQKNIRLLWQMVDEVESANSHAGEYQSLHQQVEQLYLQQGMAFVDTSLSQSTQQRHFVLDSKAFTQAYVARMAHVVDLQDYVFEYSRSVVEHHKSRAFWMFVMTILSSSSAVLVMLLIMFYFNHRVFSPLLMARDMLLDVSEAREYNMSVLHFHKNNEFNALFEAIHQVQGMMRKRELLASELSQMANTDVLTGLRNRAAMQAYIATLEASPHKLLHTSLIVMDIDNFKSINDQYGHLIGDLAIEFVAQKVKETIRTEDFAARYGGDELVIILQHMDLADAVELAKRIQYSVAGGQFAFADAQEPLFLSLSIGVASSASNWQDLMARADTCLLKAKAHGKNRVEFGV